MQALLYLLQWFQRQRLKCEKITDTDDDEDVRKQSDDNTWHGPFFQAS